MGVYSFSNILKRFKKSVIQLFFLLTLIMIRGGVGDVEEVVLLTILRYSIFNIE